VPEEVKAQRPDLDHEALRDNADTLPAIEAHWLTTGSGSQVKPV